jgi:hypothetical protein
LKRYEIYETLRSTARPRPMGLLNKRKVVYLNAL